MALHSFALWCGFLVLAILNGGLRQKWLIPRLGEQVGHWVSTLALCAAIFLVSWLAMTRIQPANTSDAMLVGAGWTLLTVAFEFLAGHFLFGNPWTRLLADDNLAQGRMWLLAQ